MAGALCVVLVCFAFLISAEPVESQQSSPEPKPNIVWIMTDDQDFRSWRRMPNVRELAKGGTYFPRTFATTSQCCPSRTTLLTGQYAHNHGVKEQTAAMGGGYEKVKELGIENNALPTWLAQEGYQTAYGGKYLNQYYEANSVPPGWKQWWAYTKGMGHPDKYWVNENGSQAIIERSGLAETDYLAMKGEGFVRDASKIDRPFFLALSPFTPHKPYFHAKRHANHFNHIKAPKFPNFNEADVSDKPYWVRTRLSLGEARVQQLDEFYRDRMRGLLGVDEMVGRVVKALKESGEWENTIIVFTSDNGYLMGEHRIEGKSVPYEGSIRVPFIVAGPGIPQGMTKNQMIANIDWAPTIADWAGATPATQVDGRSIAPLLSDNPPEWRKRLLIEAWGPFQFSAVREHNELYAHHHEHDEYEYYDLGRDFHQLENAYPTMDPGLQTDLAAKLAALKDCTGQACQAAEN